MDRIYTQKVHKAQAYCSIITYKVNKPSTSTRCVKRTLLGTPEAVHRPLPVIYSPPPQK